MTKKGGHISAQLIAVMRGHSNVQTSPNRDICVKHANRIRDKGQVPNMTLGMKVNPRGAKVTQACHLFLAETIVSRFFVAVKVVARFV